MSKKISIIILFIIIIIGAALRFYRLGNTAFDRDEFFELNSSYGYFKTGHFAAWDFNFEKPFGSDAQDESSNERAEIFRWQLAQLYRFHEPTEFLTRSLGAAWGVIGILLVYLAAVSLTGDRRVGLIAAFLAAVGESEIIYSRRLRMYAMFFPMYLLFSWTVFKFYESKYAGKINTFKKVSEKIGFNFTYFIPAFLTGIVSYNTHVLTVNIVITVIIYAGLFFLFNLLLKKKLLIDKYLITVILAGAGFAAIHLPFLYDYYKSLKKNISFFRSNYDFFIQYFSDFSHIIAGIVLTLFGVWFLSKKMKKGKEAVFLFLSAFAPLTLAIFTWKREESHRYIYFLQSFGIILSAVGICGIVSLAAAGLKRFKTAAVVILLAGFVFLINCGYIYNKKAKVYAANSSSYYPNFRKIHDFVNSQMKPGEVMITRAYRSFYWRGQKIKVYDIKSLSFGSSRCDQKIDKIVKENPSGWVVYPKVDKLNICKAGRDYYKNNLARIKDAAIPSSVEVYRWPSI